MIIIVLLLSSCQPTPEEIIQPKGDSFLDALNTPGVGDDNLPTHADEPREPNLFDGYTTSWEDTIQVKPYPQISVSIDASIITPHTSSLPVFEVQRSTFTKEKIDAFLGVFGSEQYHLKHDIKTKQYYMETILDAQKFLADTAYWDALPDPDTHEAEKQSIKAGIELNKEFMKDAPESFDDTIVIFTNKYIIMESIEPFHYRESDGTITVDGGMKSYDNVRRHFEDSNTEVIDVKWENGNYEYFLTCWRSDTPTENDFHYLNTTTATKRGRYVISDATDIQGFSLTMDAAKVMAQEAIALLGFDYLDVMLSGKEVNYENDYFNKFTPDKYTEGGYIFYFSRKIGNVAETLASYNLNFTEQYSEPWPYSQCYVTVDESGITEIFINGAYTNLGNKISEDAPLLPLADVQKIAVDQFNIGNIKFQGNSYISVGMQGIKSVDLIIDEVVFGYTKVKLTDGRYMLVPTWDFFGQDIVKSSTADFTVDSRLLDEASSFRHSYLTINAIDGSIIDRSLGY